MKKREFPFCELLSTFELRAGIPREMVQMSVLRLFDCDSVVKWTPSEKRASHACFQKALTLDLIDAARRGGKPVPGPDNGKSNVARNVLLVFDSTLSSASHEPRRTLLEAFRQQEIPTACLFSLLSQVGFLSRITKQRRSYFVFFRLFLVSPWTMDIARIDFFCPSLVLFSIYKFIFPVVLFNSGWY